MTGFINGIEVEHKKDETILSVARRYNIFIPTLCEMAGLDHTPGSCRVCLVDIKSQNSDKHHHVTSCTTPHGNWHGGAYQNPPKFAKCNDCR